MMTKPLTSEKFTVEDIQKVREYNSLRHVQMNPQEIIDDTKKGAEKVLKIMAERKAMKAQV